MKRLPQLRKLPQNNPPAKPEGQATRADIRARATDVPLRAQEGVLAYEADAPSIAFEFD